MLGLKREIIKERDAVGDVGEGGTKEIQVEDTRGDAYRCNMDVWSSLFSTETAGNALAKITTLYHRKTIRAETMSYKLHVKLK